MSWTYSGKHRNVMTNGAFWNKQLKPAKGYCWVDSDSGTSMAVKPQPGLRKSGGGNSFYDNLEPDEGFEWNNPSEMTVRPKEGLVLLDNMRLAPAPGYMWVNSYSSSKEVRLKPGLVKEADGRLRPQDTHKWVHPNDPDNLDVARRSILVLGQPGVGKTAVGKALGASGCDLPIHERTMTLDKALEIQKSILLEDYDLVIIVVSVQTGGRVYKLDLDLINLFEDAFRKKSTNYIILCNKSPEKRSEEEACQKLDKYIRERLNYPPQSVFVENYDKTMERSDDALFHDSGSFWPFIRPYCKGEQGHFRTFILQYFK